MLLLLCKPFLFYTFRHYLLIFFQKYNSFKKFLRQSDFERDQLLRIKCDDLIKRINKFTMEDPDENEENNVVEETLQKQKNTKIQSVSTLNIFKKKNN